MPLCSCRECCTCKACLRNESNIELVEQQFARLDHATKRQYARELLSQTDVRDELRDFVDSQVSEPRHRPREGSND